MGDRAKDLITNRLEDSDRMKVEQFKLDDDVKVVLIHKGREVMVDGVVDGVGGDIGLSITIEDDRRTDITGLSIFP